MADFYKVLINSIVSFLFLFIIAKLLGKKQIAQLNFVDYVIGISIGSIAAEMATDAKTPFYYYLIGMALFTLLDLLISFVARKNVYLKKALNGKPIVLIYEGKINYENLKKSKIDVNDLLALSREQGYFDLNNIAYALLEISGKLSIMPKGEQRQPVISDLDIQIQPSSLPNYLVVDGVISKSGLNEINKDTNWLLNKLNIPSENDLDKFILVSYNNENDNLNIHYKE